MAKEMVLYYNPSPSKKSNMVKGVLVCLGMRIRNVTQEQVSQKVGFLAGMDGFEALEAEDGLPAIGEEMMVLYGLSDRRLNELLMALGRAQVPRIDLKAVVTNNNSRWTFYELYEELKREHAAFNKEAKE